MGFIDFLSIVGSIASIAGAYWAILEARKAAESAEVAERVLAEVVGLRKVAEVTVIYAETKRILLTVVAQVGPSSDAQRIKGVQCSAIASEVERFFTMLLEQSGSFPPSLRARIVSLRDELKPQIEGLSVARSFEEKKGFGRIIYYGIESVLQEIKDLSDSGRDNLVKP